MSGTNPAFGDSVGIGFPERGGDDMKTFSLENSIKSLAERAVGVMDQETQGLFAVGKFPNQLPMPAQNGFRLDDTDVIPELICSLMSGPLEFNGQNAKGRFLNHVGSDRVVESKSNPLPVGVE